MHAHILSNLPDDHTRAHGSAAHALPELFHHSRFCPAILVIRVIGGGGNGNTSPSQASCPWTAGGRSHRSERTARLHPTGTRADDAHAVHTAAAGAHGQPGVAGRHANGGASSASRAAAAGSNETLAATYSAVTAGTGPVVSLCPRHAAVGAGVAGAGAQADARLLAPGVREDLLQEFAPEGAPAYTHR